MFNWWNYKTLQWASYESITGVEVSMRKEGPKLLADPVFREKLLF